MRLVIGGSEWFVLTIGTTGFFLIAYKITENNLDNTLSIVGGACALLIPIFSTGRTAAEKLNGYPLTPRQNLFGERAVQVVHFAASVGFIVALGGISILFGRREGARPDHGNHRPKRFWRIFHFACAGAIGVAGIWILVTLKIVDGPYWSLLAGETACAVAFGASWFAKGFEIQYLLGRGQGAVGPGTLTEQVSEAVPGAVGIGGRKPSVPSVAGVWHR